MSTYQTGCDLGIPKKLKFGGLDWNLIPRMTSTQIFLPRSVDVEVLDDLHFLLKEYVRELEKKKRAMKKEAKESPSVSDELKDSIRLIRSLQRSAEKVLDDIEFHVRLEDDGESDLFSEGESE
jgi:hypothetical protein